MTPRHIALLIALWCIPTAGLAQDADKPQADKGSPEKLPTIASKIEKLGIKAGEELFKLSARGYGAVFRSEGGGHCFTYQAEFAAA